MFRFGVNMDVKGVESAAVALVVAVIPPELLIDNAVRNLSRVTADTLQFRFYMGEVTKQLLLH